LRFSFKTTTAERAFDFAVGIKQRLRAEFFCGLDPFALGDDAEARRIYRCGAAGKRAIEKWNRSRGEL